MTGTGTVSRKMNFLGLPNVFRKGGTFSPFVSVPFRVSEASSNRVFLFEQIQHFLVGHAERTHWNHFD